MANGSSISPFFMKGALIELSDRFIGSVPNIIVFQYNPETITRTLEAWAPPDESATAGGAGSAKPGTAQPSDPPEKFTFVLQLDASDALERPELHPVEFVAGVGARIAAIEMLLYPKKENLMGGLRSLPADALGGGAGPIQKVFDKIKEAAGIKPERLGPPIVLFAWGADRILPVRLVSLAIEEQAYSRLLSPIRAKLSLEMKVLSPDEIKDASSSEFSKKMAIHAFNYTLMRKRILATSNIAGNVESILAMLPF